MSRTLVTLAFPPSKYVVLLEVAHVYPSKKLLLWQEWKSAVV